MAEQTRVLWDEEISDASTENHWFDFAQIFSRLNRKQYHQVDSKGNAQVYLLRIRQQSNNATDNSEIRTKLETAPNNYVTKQAVKAWHRARVKMLERQGVSLKSLSPYTRNLRVRLDTSAPTGGTSNAELTVGTPELSSFVVESQLDSDVSTALTSASMVDDYTLTVLSDHVTESTDPTTKYTTVGMNKAWLDARRKPYTVPDGTLETGVGATAIRHEENPLYEIMSGSSIAEELSEVIQDEQIQEPPWYDGDHIAHMIQGNLYSALNSPQETIIEVPLGLLKASITDLRSSNNTNVYWEVELLDIYDM